MLLRLWLELWLCMRRCFHQGSATRPAALCLLLWRWWTGCCCGCGCDCRPEFEAHVAARHVAEEAVTHLTAQRVPAGRRKACTRCGGMPQVSLLPIAIGGTQRWHLSAHLGRQGWGSVDEHDRACRGARHAWQTC